MKKLFLTLAIALATACSAFAQVQMPPIPVDPQVRIGHLDNGLTYYIRQNNYPEGQVHFYIAQKVGSILEEENQRGLAHFLEHMCFNGSEHFADNGIVKYCEKIGVKFGADLNAYTAIDETVYNIDNVPVGTTPSAIDSCLWILHDWADGLLLTGEDIDHERGVIHEEWRSRTSGSAVSRMYEKILPEIYPNNRYGERMPIGTMEVVDNFPYKALRDYYEKWYRPDLQGIIVVGDIDVDAIEAKIKNIFGTIAKPVNPAERYYVQVADNVEPIISIAKDKEQQYAITYLWCKHDVYPDSLKSYMSYYVTDYAKGVAEIMLSQRLEELAQLPNPPFIQAGISDSRFFFAKTKDAFNGVAVTNEAGLTEGITTVYREMLRAARHGFTESEYERARAEVLTHIESAYNERDKVKSKSYCKAYVSHFISNDPIASIEDEYAWAKEILPRIPVSVINEYIKDLASDKNLVMACMLPDKEGVTYPTAEELKKALADVYAENIAAYEDKVSNEPLLAETPKAGKVVKTENASFDYKKLTLSNGVVVYLKTTDFKADQILMSAFSNGGTSLYDDKDVVNLKVVDEVFTLGGVGNFSATELNKALSGKKVSVSPSINTYSETLDGNTTPKDFETMLQLTHLYFTAQRADNDAFQSWKTKTNAILANAALKPMTALRDTIRKELYPDLARLQSLQVEEIEQIDYARCMQIAKERFANAADFTFIFTGNIDENTMIPMLEQYLGSLPTQNEKENYRDFGALPRNGVRENVFQREMEIPMATSLLANNGTDAYNLKNKLVYSLADQILDIILTEEIREKEGGTYGISVSANLNYLPKPFVMFQIYYQTDPDKYEFLNKRINEIVNDFVKAGPSETNMAKVKEYMIKKHIENLRENSYFSKIMKEYLLSGTDLCTDYEKTLQAISIDDVKSTFDNFLKQGNHAKVIMTGIKQ